MKNNYNLTMDTSSETIEDFVNSINEIIDSFERSYDYDFEFDIIDEIQCEVFDDSILMSLKVAFNQMNRIPRMITFTFDLDKDGHVMNLTDGHQLRTTALQELNEDLESELGGDLNEMKDLYNLLLTEYHKTPRYISENRNVIINQVLTPSTEKL